MKMKFYSIWLALVMIIIFLVQTFFGGFTDLFILNNKYPFEIWRYLTAVFLHGSLTHLIFNLFGLILFGLILESIVGSRRFLIVFLVTGVLANIVAINFYDLSLGASGAIFGVMGAIIFIKPLMAVWAYGMPMPMFVAGILWAGADILGVFGYGSGGVGNIAHLSGMLFGLSFGAFYRRLIPRDGKKNRIVIDEGSMRQWEENYMK